MVERTPGQETYANPHDAHKNKPTKAQQKAKTEKALKSLVKAKEGDVIKPADINARKKYVERIQTTLGKSVATFIEVGRLLLEAKEKLAHGQFELMLTDDLKMTRATAARLMRIAEHPVLSNVTHVQHLPPAWGTLYELTKVPTPRLEAKLKDGTINPQMERADVKELLPKKKSTKNTKYGDDGLDPEEETTATTSGLGMTDQVGAFIRRVTSFVIEEFAPDLEQWLKKSRTKLSDEERRGLDRELEACALRLQELAQSLR